MPLEITSGSFSAELKRRKEVFAQGMGAVLKLPPELWWVWLQEHGTALRGDKPGQSYDIYPKAGKLWLTWIGPNGARVFLEFIKDHPGIPPKHFVAQEQEEICRDLAVVVAQTLLESGWDFEAVKDAFLNIGMEQVKKRVAAAIKLSLDGAPRADGKLHAQSPEEPFIEGAYIEAR
jgi:hypothetical protein